MESGKIYISRAESVPLYEGRGAVGGSGLAISMLSRGGPEGREQAFVALKIKQGTRNTPTQTNPYTLREV